MQPAEKRPRNMLLETAPAPPADIDDMPLETAPAPAPPAPPADIVPLRWTAPAPPTDIVPLETASEPMMYAMPWVGEIVADLYYYWRNGVTVAILALLVVPGDNFGPAAFLNDHNTFSGIHGWTENITTDAGDLFKVVVHFHCLGQKHLDRRPDAQVEMIPGQAYGEVNAMDHKKRAIVMRLFARRQTFANEASLRIYMEAQRRAAMGHVGFDVISPRR